MKYIKQIVHFLLGCLLFIGSFQVTAKTTDKLRKGLPVKFSELPPSLGKIDMPGAIKDFLSKITLENTYLDPDLSDEDRAVFRGNVKYDRKIIAECVLTLEKILVGEKKIEAGLMIQYPAKWKLSSLLPELAYVDRIITSRPALVISDFSYTDPIYELDVDEGVNFFGDLDLSQFKSVKKFFDLLGKAPGTTVTGGGKASLKGLIARDIKSSFFKAILPMQISTDFKKLYDEKKIKFWPMPIKKITTQPIISSIDAKLTFIGESGLEYDLSTQKEPLTLFTTAKFGPTFAGFEGRTQGLLLGPKWLKLGDVTMGVEFDYPLLPAALALGIPFTGATIGGGLLIGKPGEHQITMKALASVSFTSTPDTPKESIGTILLTGSVTNVQLASFLYLLMDMTGQ